MKKLERVLKFVIFDIEKSHSEGPKGNFLGMQKITLETFRMLNCDDFISYSSYTTKIYLKNSAWFGSKLVEKLSFLTPFGGHFFNG